MKLKKTIRKFVLDLMYPPFCVNCGKNGKWICENCSKKLIGVFPECYVCNKISRQFCTHKSCLTNESPLRRVFVGWYYKSLSKRALAFYKYKGAYKVAVAFGELLSEQIKYFGIVDSWDLRNTVFTCVPLHKSKYNTRGFNQSELLMNYVGNRFNVDCFARLLIRTKNNVTQTKLNYKERKNNVKGIFDINPRFNMESLKNKRVIIFDDVITTGSTLNSAAKVICNRGLEVEAVCLLRGGNRVKDLNL